MDVFERRLDVLAAQLVPSIEQLALAPTAGAAAATDAAAPLVEPGAYAIPLPEVLGPEATWDVYR